jgi:hypothetical protein
MFKFLALLIIFSASCKTTTPAGPGTSSDAASIQTETVNGVVFYSYSLREYFDGTGAAVEEAINTIAQKLEELAPGIGAKEAAKQIKNDNTIAQVQARAVEFMRQASTLAGGVGIQAADLIPNAFVILVTGGPFSNIRKIKGGDVYLMGIVIPRFYVGYTKNGKKRQFISARYGMSILTELPLESMIEMMRSGAGPGSGGAAESGRGSAKPIRFGAGAIFGEIDSANDLSKVLVGIKGPNNLLKMSTRTFGIPQNSYDFQMLGTIDARALSAGRLFENVILIPAEKVIGNRQKAHRSSLIGGFNLDLGPIMNGLLGGLQQNMASPINSPIVETNDPAATPDAFDNLDSRPPMPSFPQPTAPAVVPATGQPANPSDGSGNAPPTTPLGG